MRKVKYLILTMSILLAFSAAGFGDTGVFDVNLGYTYIDEDGNLASNQSSYNYYDGLGVSLEKARFIFDNGIILNSNLRNVNLDNRNLYFNVTKPGLFGADVTTNKYRRYYNFEGTDYTKRDLTAAKVWINPVKYVKLFAGGNFNNLSGKIDNLYETSFLTIPRDVDYSRNKFSFGGSFKYQQRVFRAEYGTAKFEDDINNANNQKRNLVRLLAMTPAPRYEWLILSGAFQRFETKYTNKDLKITSTYWKGSALAYLNKYFTLNYVAFFNRAGSDEAPVKTDNLAHMAYLSYALQHRWGATIGYQYHTKDDFYASVKSNAVYFDFWTSVHERLELKAVFGYRAEDVDDGSRLIGDETRNNFDVSAKYKFNSIGYLKAGFASKQRKFDQLGSEIQYTRWSADGGLSVMKYGSLNAGYSFTDGDFDNIDQQFEYKQHQVNGGISINEYKNVTLGFMLIYYRTRRDLDIEGSDLRFTGAYHFKGNQRLEVTYNVFNFDDYMFLDQYYTGNIVEINIIKTFKF